MWKFLCGKLESGIYWILLFTIGFAILTVVLICLGLIKVSLVVSSKGFQLMFYKPTKQETKPLEQEIKQQPTNNEISGINT